MQNTTTFKRSNTKKPTSKEDVSKSAEEENNPLIDKEGSKWFQDIFAKMNMNPDEIKKYYKIFHKLQNPPEWFVPAIKLNVG